MPLPNRYVIDMIDTQQRRDHDPNMEQCDPKHDNGVSMQSGGDVAWHDDEGECDSEEGADGEECPLLV
jgi:hypothetical protein